MYDIKFANSLGHRIFQYFKYLAQEKQRKICAISLSMSLALSHVKKENTHGRKKKNQAHNEA
jgi:hypothetical protein